MWLINDLCQLIWSIVYKHHGIDITENQVCYWLILCVWKKYRWKIGCIGQIRVTFKNGFWVSWMYYDLWGWVKTGYVDLTTWFIHYFFNEKSSGVINIGVCFGRLISLTHFYLNFTHLIGSVKFNPNGFLRT